LLRCTVDGATRSVFVERGGSGPRAGRGGARREGRPGEPRRRASRPGSEAGGPCRWEPRGTKEAMAGTRADSHAACGGAPPSMMW